MSHDDTVIIVRFRPGQREQTSQTPPSAADGRARSILDPHIRAFRRRRPLVRLARWTGAATSGEVTA